MWPVMHRYRLPEENLRIFEQIIAHSSNAIFLADDNNNLTFANHPGRTLFHRLIATHQLNIALSPDEKIIEINDGIHPRYIRTHCVMLQDPDTVPGYVFIGTDITAELTAQREEAHMRQRLEQALEITDEGFWFWDIPSGNISHNHCWSHIFGFSDDQLIHRESDVIHLIHPDDIEQARQAMVQHLRGKTPTYNCEYRVITPQGNILWVANHGKVVRHDEKGMAVEMLGKTQDITEKKLREQEMHQLAWHDPLTQLENRPRFYHSIELARQQSRSDNEYIALLYLDLNRFKEVNDTLGHNAGDQLLKEIAQRLRLAIRNHDSIARLGGDEFALLVRHLGSNYQDARGKLIVLANRILDNIGQDIQIENNIVTISSSIGIYLFNNDPAPVADMLHKADMAQYYSKRNNRKWMVWSEKLCEKQSQRDTIETGLHRALDNGEFYLEYQPQYAENGKVIRVEALLRWRTPQGKMIAPSLFIPVAENSGLIFRINEWALDQVCRQISLWQLQPGFDTLPISINISSRQLKRTDFLKSIERVLAQHKIDPQRLNIEIPEIALSDNLPDTQYKLRVLKEMKIQVVMANFGTGMVSLTGLRKLAINEVKIDRSLVLNMTENSDMLLTLRGIIAMCQALNINIVADGVETKGQFSALCHMGCHHFQGGFFSRALAAEQLPDVLQQYSPSLRR